MATGPAHDFAAAERYWAALARKDAATMASCYAPDALFHDPVFDLKGGDVGRMWMMLFAGAPDLRVQVGPLVPTPLGAEGTWEAWYTFGATGRRVRNVIHSRFVLRDGAIAAQVDHFRFWRWSRQALGPVGALLGWTPLVRRRVRRQAAKRLARHAAR